VLDAVRETFAEKEAWVVGGAVRDELLGRPLVDLDVAVDDPRAAAEAYAERAGGAVFSLSERHGAWRVARRDGRTVDFTPLPADGIEADLATRDFTVNAIARPLAGGEEVDPFGGLADLRDRQLRTVSPSVFADDPLRLLRAVRFEQELRFRMDEETERLVREHAALVTRPAGERILDELSRLEAASFRRLDELGLLEPLGGSLDHLSDFKRTSNSLLLVTVFGDSLRRLPISRELSRYARTLLRAELPHDLDARSVHRFRRATEPWSLDAVAFLGGGEDVTRAVEAARAVEADEPLVRGDELGLPPGPAIGRILERIEEERAAGTISTREEALELARREAQ
jgi:tRNA nucleotidyltransferase/poly(A) polymerase